MLLCSSCRNMVHNVGRIGEEAVFENRLTSQRTTAD